MAARYRRLVGRGRVWRRVGPVGAVGSGGAEPGHPLVVSSARSPSAATMRPARPRSGKHTGVLVPLAWTKPSVVPASTVEGRLGRPGAKWAGRGADDDSLDRSEELTCRSMVATDRTRIRSAGFPGRDRGGPAVVSDVPLVTQVTASVAVRGGRPSEEVRQASSGSSDGSSAPPRTEVGRGGQDRRVASGSALAASRQATVYLARWASGWPRRSRRAGWSGRP